MVLILFESAECSQAFMASKIAPLLTGSAAGDPSGADEGLTPGKNAKFAVHPLGEDLIENAMQEYVQSRDLPRG